MTKNLNLSKYLCHQILFQAAFAASSVSEFLLPAPTATFRNQQSPPRLQIISALQAESFVQGFQTHNKEYRKQPLLSPPF